MKTIAADVRLAEAADAGSLARVHASSWQSAYRGLIPHRALSAMIERRGVEWWARAIGNNATILVLEYGGDIAGYATVGRNRTRGLSAQGEVYEIYMRPEFQGVGFGRRLFDSARMLLRARGLGGTVVWALTDNDNAMRFYQSAGGADIATGSETFDGVTLQKVAFSFV